MFAIYSAKSRGCKFVRSVNIAGILCRHIVVHAESRRDDTLLWEISGQDLCSAAMQQFEIKGDAKSHKLVIDATFSRADVLLLEINHIWGYSYPQWTPIALRLTTLTEGLRPEGPSTPLKQFHLSSESIRIRA